MKRKVIQKPEKVYVTERLKPVSADFLEDMPRPSYFIREDTLLTISETEEQMEIILMDSKGRHELIEHVFKHPIGKELTQKMILEQAEDLLAKFESSNLFI